jgi:hypothetical protein
MVAVHDKVSSLVVDVGRKIPGKVPGKVLECA